MFTRACSLLFFLSLTAAANAIEPYYEGPDGVLAQVFSPNCLNCHSSSRAGALRNGAPPGLDWDEYDSARNFGERIVIRAAVQMTMPPPGSGIPALDQAQRDALLAWEAAGFPRAPSAPPPAQSPRFEFSDLRLTLPVVEVGAERYSASLSLLELPDSPLGFGFELVSAAATSETSDSAVSFDPQSGVVTLPLVQLLEADGSVSESASAQMRLISGSDPFRFELTALNTIEP